jgi:hypothetical protein
MKLQINPLEAMVEDFATVYVDLVKSIAATMAPFRPWWTADLSPDEQLWRWSGDGGPRQEVLDWLMQAGAYMGWQNADEVLAHIEDIFTSPAAQDLIPPEVVVQIPVALLEMVQGTGPKDTANHIRKMERMQVGRLQALSLLANTDQPSIPEPPIQPPPEPVQLADGAAGYPLYGMAPQELGSKKGLPTTPNLSGR